MRFLSAAALGLLVVPIALVIAYVVAQLRRPKYAVRFTNLDLLDVVAPSRPNWRRHIGAALLTAGLVALVVALARPARTEDVAVERATVIVAIDVSLSMDADDVDPTRLDAAKAAATTFIDSAPDEVRIGLVAFNATASVRVAPTTDRPALTSAIGTLRLGEGTAIGEAIFASLDALEADRAQLGVEEEEEADEDVGAGDGAPVDGPPPERIVVMSDGETTQGRPNEEGVAAAQETGVPVSTVAFGTEDGVIEIDGTVSYVPVAPGPLRDIADATGGQFFETATEEGLAEVFSEIGSQAGTETRDVELGRAFLWIGAGLTAAAATASLVWAARLP